MSATLRKTNSKGIRKVYIIFLARTNPNKCSVRAMFERAQKEVLADEMKLDYFSPLLYVETMKRSLIAYEYIRLENASDVKKKKSANFLHLFLPIVRTM